MQTSFTPDTPTDTNYLTQSTQMDPNDKEMMDYSQISQKPGSKRVAIRCPVISPQKEITEQSAVMDMDEEEDTLQPSSLETQFQKASGYEHMITDEIAEKIRTDTLSTKDWDNPQFFETLLEAPPLPPLSVT